MSSKKWLYPRRRERLREVVRAFEAEHKVSPTTRQIHEATGWSEKTIREYLAQLVQEGESLYTPRISKNADRFKARRDQLLSCVQAYLAEHGYFPTLREICNETGWDRNTVRRYLQRLALEGILLYNPGRRRTLAAGPAFQTERRGKIKSK